MKMNTNTDPYLTMGSFMLRNGKLIPAEKAFRKFIEINGKDFRGHFNLAQVLHAKGDLDSALQSYESTIELNSQANDAYLGASTVLIKLKRPQEAINICYKCILKCSYDPSCVYNLNIALRQLGRCATFTTFICIFLITTKLRLKDALLLSWRIMGRHISSTDLHKRAPSLHKEHKHRSLLPLTFIAVKFGKKYDANYVNILYKSIERHLFSVKRNSTMKNDHQHASQEQIISMLSSHGPTMSLGCTNIGSTEESLETRNSPDEFLTHSSSPLRDLSQNHSRLGSNTGICDGEDGKDDGDGDGEDGFEESQRQRQDHEEKSGFRFICLTEDSTGLLPDIAALPLPSCSTIDSNGGQRWDGWWHKASLFSPSLHPAPPAPTTPSLSAVYGESGAAPMLLEEGAVAVYLDLDTVVCGDLGWLLELVNSHYHPTSGDHSFSPSNPPSVETAAEDDRVPEYSLVVEGCAQGGRGDVGMEWEGGGRRRQEVGEPVLITLSAGTFQCEGREEGINSSLMVWRVGNPALCRLYSFLEQHYSDIRKVIYKFDHYLEMMLLGDPATEMTSEIPVAYSTSGKGENEEYDVITGGMGEVLKKFQQASEGVGEINVEKDRTPISHMEIETRRNGGVVYVGNPSKVIDYHDMVKRVGDELDIERLSEVIVEEGISIVCFPLQLKPHDVCDLPWVKHFWSV